MTFGKLVKDLSRSLRCDQHVVGKELGAHGNAEQRREGGVASSASVEAKDELVEVGMSYYPGIGQ